MKEENMRVEEMDAYHLEIAGDLFFDVFKKEPWNFDWLTIENVRGYFSAIESSINFKGYLLYKGETLIGACLGEVNPYFQQVTYDIKEIYIMTEKQGEGLGTEFLLAIENHLSSQGVTVVSLLTSSTIPAFEFYKKNGYSVNDTTANLHKLIG